MLLSKIITSEWFDIQRLARELVVPERTVALYMTGELEMPLERQACLARFLIAHVPQLARTSRNLLGQIQAAAAFATTDTATHSIAPGPTTRSF